MLHTCACVHVAYMCLCSCCMFAFVHVACVLAFMLNTCACVHVTYVCVHVVSTCVHVACVFVFMLHMCACVHVAYMYLCSCCIHVLVLMLDVC